MESINSKEGRASGSISRSPEVVVITAIEAFAGIRYLLRTLLSPVELMPVTLAMMIASFVIAFGLWKLSKWAWYLTFVMSIFGVMGGSATLLLESLAGLDVLSQIPYVLLDVFVIAVLLRKNVRVTYRISRL